LAALGVGVDGKPRGGGKQSNARKSHDRLSKHGRDSFNFWFQKIR
jgi:hypothetical protein